jgi:hypothetical protein
MLISPVMLLPYMYWRRWMQMVVAQCLPLAEPPGNEASARAELNEGQPDAPARYVG